VDRRLRIGPSLGPDLPFFSGKGALLFKDKKEAPAGQNPTIAFKFFQIKLLQEGRTFLSQENQLHHLKTENNRCPGKS
jgi:hypothetical protein